MDLDVKYFLSFYKVTDSIWPLGGWVNIVSARCVADIPISFPFFCAVLIGLSFLLLCGIPLTLSPWIKILINLSVSLSSYSWKGKEREVEEGKGNVVHGIMRCTQIYCGGHQYCGWNCCFSLLILPPVSVVCYWFSVFVRSLQKVDIGV